MASIKKRNNSYCVVYRYIDADGNKRQKWESYKTMTEARTRQKEIEYKERIGTFVIPQCKTMNELLAQNTGKTLKTIEKDTERDHFMTAEQARDYGLIDEIITPRR